MQGKNRYAISVKTQISDSEWFSFLQKCRNKNIFQTPYMRNIFANTYNYQPFSYFACDETGEIVSSLLATTIRDNVPLSYFSRRAIVNGGPLLLENEKGIIGAKLLIEKFREDMKSKAIFAEIRNHRLTHEIAFAFQRANFNFIDHLNVLIDLKQSKDLIWRALKKRKRAGVKRALRRGVYCKKIEEKSEMKEFYRILSKIYYRAKIPLADESLFMMVLQELNPKGFVYPFILKVGEKTIGGRIPLLFDGKIFAWYAGALRNYSRFRPSDLSVWEILKWGCENDYSVFDFGGAGHPNEKYGVRDFKMQFGGKVVNYGRYLHLLHPNYNKISQIGFKIWRKVGYLFGTFSA